MEIIFKCVSDSVPNWFDWLSLGFSLIVSIFSIIGAFLLGERNYKRDKKNREEENSEKIKSQKKLFRDNLEYIKEIMSNQIDDLKKYKETLKFSINPSIEIDFLKYVDVASLYKDNDRNEVNKLLSVLYQLYGFSTTLTSNIKFFRDFYQRAESDFLKGHTEVFLYQSTKLINKKGIDIDKEIKDEFMKSYLEIVFRYRKDLVSLQNKKIDNNVIYKHLLELNFLISMYVLSDKDIEELAIHTNNALLCYKEILDTKNAHFQSIDNFIKYLEDRIKVIRDVKPYLHF